MPYLNPKIQTNLRLEPKLREALQVQAGQKGCTVTDLITTYCKRGLEQDAGAAVTSPLAGAVEKAVERGISYGLGAVYKKLQDDVHQEIRTQVAEIREANKRTDNRLAGLIVKATRNAALARFFIEGWMKRTSSSYAHSIITESWTQAGEELQKKAPAPEE